MFIIHLLTYLKGFVRISVTGRFVERFLNICINRNIYVWNIKNRGSELLHLNMSVKGFKGIAPVARKSKTRVRIISRHGLPFFLHRHKKRKIFLLSGIAAAVMLICITSFVWVIEVDGNVKVSDEAIIEALDRNGFKVGTLRYGNDIFDLQNKMLLEVDELSWLWVEIKGTRAVVKVKERVPVPHIVDRGNPCNIVAETDGLITEMNATYGQKIASIGDVVKKGDLLISGISNTKYGGIHYLHSSGVIKARTWHSKSGEFPLVKINFSKTGKKFSKNTINFFGFRVKLYMNEKIPFEHSEEESKIHRLSIGENFVLPISFEQKCYYELLKEEIPLTAEEAELSAVATLCAEIESGLGSDTSVVNKTHITAPLPNGNINVKVDYECIEEISLEVPIEVQ